MRIFIFILSLIFSAAFVLLNVLGFNGALTLNEFFLVNVIAEVLVCLLLGHFMFRTYANHKKLKKLQQEMATRQASSVAHEQAAMKKHTLKRKKKEPVPATEIDPPKPPAATPQQPPTASRIPQQDPRKAPVREQAPLQQPMSSNITQPMHPVHQETTDLDATALYNTPFGK